MGSPVVRLPGRGRSSRFTLLAKRPGTRVPRREGCEVKIHGSGAIPVALAAICLLVAGCDSSTPSPPNPSPDVAPTIESERERAERIVFDAAEMAYRSNMQAQDRLYSGTGKKPDFGELRMYATGEYLGFIEDDILALRAKGWRSSEPTLIVGISRETASADRATIKSCEDNSGVRLINSSGRDVTPKLIRRYVQTLVVTKTGGNWKVAETSSLKVDSFSNQDCGSS